MKSKLYIFKRIVDCGFESCDDLKPCGGVTIVSEEHIASIFRILCPALHGEG
jgi:hypothetical protein